jgi:hypothetical protein
LYYILVFLNGRSNVSRLLVRIGNACDDDSIIVDLIRWTRQAGLSLTLGRSPQMIT